MEYVINTNVLRTTVTSPKGGLTSTTTREDPAGSMSRRRSRFTVSSCREGAARVRVLSIRSGLCGQSASESGDDLRRAANRRRRSRYHMRTNAPLPYLESANQYASTSRSFLRSATASRQTPFRGVRAACSGPITIAGWRAWAKSCALPRFASLPVLRSRSASSCTLTRTPARLSRRDHGFPKPSDPSGVGLPLLLAARPGVRGGSPPPCRPPCGRRSLRGVLRDVAEAGPLQPLYGIGGERELVEQHSTSRGILRQQAGAHRHSAYFQRQHDSDGRDDLCLDTISRIRACDRGKQSRIADGSSGLWRSAMVAVESDDTGSGVPEVSQQVHFFSRLVLGCASRGATLVRRLGRGHACGRVGGMGRSLPGGDPRSRV